MRDLITNTIQRYGWKRDMIAREKQQEQHAVYPHEGLIVMFIRMEKSRVL